MAIVPAAVRSAARARVDRASGGSEGPAAALVAAPVQVAPRRAVPRAVPLVAALAAEEHL
jgi:hypothetical protein